MNQPISKLEVMKRCIHSDFEMDQAILRFLTHYTIYSLANQVRGLPMSSFPRILISLSTIQKYHYEKIKLYQALSLGNLRLFVSSNLIEKLDRIEKEVNDIVRLMEALNYDPLVRRHLDDLVQNVQYKIRLYQSMLQSPAKPWISPIIRCSSKGSF